MLWSTLTVCDAAATKQLLKLRRTAPRRVLAALVGQHLTRFAVLGDAAFERFDDKTGLLVMGHRPRHQIPRVVVHEADEVHALMPTQLEREDVALPKLIRLGALEPALWLVTRHDLFALGDQTCFVQDPPDRRLRHTEAFEAREHVADPPRAPLGVRRARRYHGVGRWVRLRLALLRRANRSARDPKTQSVYSATLEQRDEFLNHRE